MSKILVINSSVSGEASVSRQMVRAITNKLLASHTNSEVKTYDLASAPFPHVDPLYTLALNQSLSTPVDTQSELIKATLERSNEAIKDINWADHIVIAVPFYNFSVPSTLKAWIDHICRPGVSFVYSEKGPEGLIKGKKVYLAISSGGVYSSGPMSAFDFTESYLKAVLGFLGMTDVTTYRAEGIAFPGNKEKALEQALASINS